MMLLSPLLGISSLTRKARGFFLLLAWRNVFLTRVHSLPKKHLPEHHRVKSVMSLY